MKVAAYCAVAGIDIAWSLHFAAEIVHSDTVSVNSILWLAAFSAGTIYFVLAAIVEATE